MPDSFTDNYVAPGTIMYITGCFDVGGNFGGGRIVIDTPPAPPIFQADHALTDTEAEQLSRLANERFGLYDAADAPAVVPAREG